MRRMKKWIMGLSIRKKLVFYCYAIMTPILLLISFLLFCHNYRAAIKSEEAGNIQNVKRLSDSIEVIQKNIMEMGTYICINNDVTKILSSDKPEELNRDAQVWLHQAPMQIIQDMMALNGYMKTIAIYPENGVNPYLRCMDYSSYIGNMESIRRQEIYQLAMQEKGKSLWQRVEKYQSDTYQSNRNDKIVMYRAMYDLKRKNRLGYLVIGSSAEKFDEICLSSLNHDGEAAVVVSEYGAELVRCGDISDDMLQGILQENRDNIIGKTGIGSYTYKNYRVYLCRSKDTGVITYRIVPKAGIGNYVANVLAAPLALLLGFLIGLYPLMYFVSDLVTKPLHQLREAMNLFKHGDFSQKIEVNTNDEIGEVTECFNNMVEDIRELINKNYVMALRERESELDVLQAQINPHFLYNTLDSLYWKAVESGNDEISEDILSLAQLFRLVLNRGNGIVTVQLEMDLIERYLHIQKMRFGKRLEYEIKVEDSILEEEIPKLILQPFVENAIVHGFEKGGSDYLLSVTGKKEAEYMTFSITDTGVGMSREQLEAIWDENDTKKYASQRIGRYAIKNVKERLELTYNDNYRLDIESKEGTGTTVKVTVPIGLKEMQIHEREAADCR